jgi:hypothetical protein
MVEWKLGGSAAFVAVAAVAAVALTWELVFRV